MKKNMTTILLMAAMGAMLTACSGENEQQTSAAPSSEQEELNEQEETEMPETSEEENSDAELEGAASGETAEGQTAITLTIGDTVLQAYLEDTAPARSLAAQLPMTVSLNDSDNDFCGDNIDIEYGEEDVVSGYQNGELAFWTPANNFVIFVSGEETSAGTGDLVPLGMITEPQEALDALEGSIEVEIALAEDAEAAAGTAETTETENENEQEAGEMQIHITVGDTTLTATLEDNATTRALTEQMPLTLSMSDLYGREMCYRYGAGGLPTEELRSDGYEVGDIAYWPPMGSLVILYGQNGEQFERQHLGHIDSGVEVFETTGDAEVTFTLAD